MMGDEVKNPTGFNLKLQCSTGITGQSSATHKEYNFNSL